MKVVFNKRVMAQEVAQENAANALKTVGFADLPAYIAGQTGGMSPQARALLLALAQQVAELQARLDAIESVQR